VVPFVADPFASSLLALLRHGSTILLEDCVDSVVWQIQSMSMFQYVFERQGVNLEPVVGFQD
jgi:hypothetical protein